MLAVRKRRKLANFNTSAQSGSTCDIEASMLQEHSSSEAHAALRAASIAISVASYKEALSYCEEALRLDPSSMRACLCKAEGSLLLERYRLNAAHYDWALDLYPDLPSGER